MCRWQAPGGGIVSDSDYQLVFDACSPFGNSPLDPAGKLAKASLIWQILDTHEMPTLSCFHGEKAITYPIGNGTFYVASCKYKKGEESCGYYGK